MFFFGLSLDHTQRFSGFTPGFVLRAGVFQGTMSGWNVPGVPEMERGLTVCKTGALPAVLSP